MSNTPTSALKGGAALGLLFGAFWFSWMPWSRLTTILLSVVFLVTVGSFYLLHRSAWTARLHLGLKLLICFFSSWLTSGAALLLLDFLNLK